MKEEEKRDMDLESFLKLDITRFARAEFSEFFGIERPSSFLTASWNPSQAADSFPKARSTSATFASDTATSSTCQWQEVGSDLKISGQCPITATKTLRLTRSELGVIER
jgi:hypothetical protein